MNPSQALNIGGFPQTYSDSFTILNLAKGGDFWFYFDASNKVVELGPDQLDEKGWPEKLPVVNGEPAAIFSNIFYTQKVPAGKFILEWQGDQQVLPYQDYKVLGPNKILIDYEAAYKAADGKPQDDGITLRIEPNGGTANTVTDIKLYDARYADLIDYGEKFNPDWFQAIDDFRLLRTHGMQETNFSVLRDWNASVESADQAFWGQSTKGVPFELLVEIANDAKSDLWITIPHLATDDFMRKAAEYIKANLDENLKVYVEYTNEYWTESFDQHKYLIDQGKKLFPKDTPFANGQAYGARFSEMTQIFKDVFGADNDRLVPTITLDDVFFKTGQAEAVLNTPAYVAKGGVSPVQAGAKFVATDGYFGWFNSDPDTDALVDQWMKQADGGFGSARDFLINEINKNLVPNWQAGRKIADKYGLDLGVYEGGALLQNTVGGKNEDGAPADPKYTDFIERVSESAEMKAVYEHALMEWRKVGTGPFASFADVGRAGYYGDYGMWNNPGFKPEPRADAITADNAKDAPWLADDKRDPSVFANGLYDTGTTGKDNIRGTKLDDRLYGLAGSDTLFGRAGDDRLVGGTGKDTLRGGEGNDLLDGGAGADRIYGENGFDTLNYAFSSKAIEVDLAKGTGKGGDAAGDTISGIEKLIGSGFDDVLIGGLRNEQFFGGAGKDKINGGAGDDRLDGGLGNDVLTGGKGADLFFIGPGKDVVTDWKEGDLLAISTPSGAFGDPFPTKITQVGKDTVLSYTSGPDVWVLTLKNSLASTITITDDFRFS